MIEIGQNWYYGFPSKGLQFFAKFKEAKEKHNTK
jgi:hypothetical protein